MTVISSTSVDAVAGLVSVVVRARPDKKLGELRGVSFPQAGHAPALIK